MTKSLMFLFIAASFMFAGCREEQTYTYRYQAGSMYEYDQLMTGWFPECGRPAPLKPNPNSSTSGWVLQSSSGQIIPLSSGHEPVIINQEDFSPFNEGILVSKKILVNDPYLNQSYHKQAYYLVDPDIHYGRPYHGYHGYPYHGYGWRHRPYYGYGYGYGGRHHRSSSLFYFGY
jgi:hypothetical protein